MRKTSKSTGKSSEGVGGVNDRTARGGRSQRVKATPRKGEVLRQVQNRGLIAIPASMRADTEIFRIIARDDGVIELHPQVTIDRSQAWFWTDHWQQMEGEADVDIAEGRVDRFDSSEDFIEHLERV